MSTGARSRRNARPGWTRTRTRSRRSIFAAGSRIREGGCILADEVGLGKTIEAGLVVAQLLAEGARRVLAGDARRRCSASGGRSCTALFAIDSREAKRGPCSGGFDGRGRLSLINARQAWVGRRGRAALRRRPRGSTCASSTRRTRSSPGCTGASTAMAVPSTTPRRVKPAPRAAYAWCSLREAGTPVLLLTATPDPELRSLELWGLVQFVDPSAARCWATSATFRRAVLSATDDRVSSRPRGKSTSCSLRLRSGAPAHAAPAGAGRFMRAAVRRARRGAAVRVRHEWRRGARAVRRRLPVPARAIDAAGLSQVQAAAAAACWASDGRMASSTARARRGAWSGSRPGCGRLAQVAPPQCF
jgi:hypothetical protein